MSMEENKANVRRFVEEALNQRNLTVLDELISEDWVVHGVGGQELRGLEGARMMVAMYTAAFPDARMIIEDMVAEADKVAVRYRFEGTQQGEFMGIPPTGKKISIDGYIFNRFKDGKQVEGWGLSDWTTAMQQLGVAPSS